MDGKRPARNPDEMMPPHVLAQPTNEWPRSDARQFFNAILWLARSGARWRNLSEDRAAPNGKIITCNVGGPAMIEDELHVRHLVDKYRPHGLLRWGERTSQG